MTRARTIADFGDGIADADLPAGSVLQVVTVNKTDTFSTTSASFTTVNGMAASITPSSASNKILVLINFRYGGDGDVAYAARISRGATNIDLGNSDNGLSNVYAAHNNTNQGFGDYGVTVLDSPSSTAPQTYTLEVRVSGGATMYVNNRNDGVSTASSRSSITLMEIAG